MAHTALLHKGDQVVDWQLNCLLFFFLARLFPTTQIIHSFDPFHFDLWFPTFVLNKRAVLEWQCSRYASNSMDPVR